MIPVLKHSFHLFLFYSFLIHTLVFSSFFRTIKSESEDFNRDFSFDTLDSELEEYEFMDQNFFVSVLSPYMDSAVIDSLWQADSMYVKEWAALSNSLQNILDPGWYNSVQERSRALHDLLEKYIGSSLMDSLFAQSEFLRDALLKQIHQNLKKYGAKGFVDELEWKKLIEDLAEFLKQAYGSYDSTSLNISKNRELLSKLLTDPELMKLWKEAMQFSLQDVALDRMREAIQMAMGMCMSKCGKGGKGKMEGSGSKELEVSSFGKGGAFPGIGDMNAEDFEQCFLEALQMIGGPGLMQMASFFDREKLSKLLGGEARRKALEMAGGNAQFGSFLKDVDFAGTIKKALETGEVNQEGLKRAAEFLETIKKGLGEDIAGWFRDGPTQGELMKNPYYYNQWAREYLDLIVSLASAPGLLVPNLNKYAQVAKSMRERYLSSETRLTLGIGLTAQPQNREYFIPRQVYIPKKSKKPDKQREDKTLIKTDSYTNAWGGAVRSTKPVILDGNLNEWQRCKPFALYGSGQGLDKLPPQLQNCNCLFVQWDNQGLYFAYTINDMRDNKYFAKIFWDTDALEIFLDPHNLKDSRRIKDRSYQFWVWPRAKSKEGSTGQSVFSSPRAYTPKILKDGIIRYASIRKGSQYTCEVFVPGGLLKRWYPLPGKVIGFNYSINNGEGVLIRWVTNVGRNISYHPELWGDLFLMGSDAEIKLSPEDFIFPGQNLKITIADHDMNLKAQERDKIWVKVSSRLTGDQIPLALMETDENSGIFSTDLGTVFALKPKEKERISVRPGDILEVYYLDQYTLGGKKNVPLVKEIQVGRGVFSLGTR